MQQNNRNITEFSFLNTMIDNVISDIHPSRIETHVNNLTRVRIPDTFIEETIDTVEPPETDLSAWPMADIRPIVQSPLPRRIRSRLRLRPVSMVDPFFRINQMSQRRPNVYRPSMLHTIPDDLRAFIEDTVFRQDTARAILASQNEEVKMRPADDKTISSIEEKKFTGCNGETCTVCLEDIKRGDMMKELKCKHQFHSGCIDEWLKRGDARCPNCNERID